MANQETVVTVMDVNAPIQIARIALNGYNIQAGNVFGRSGAMRSFKVVSGDVWELWDRQSPAVIQDEHGNRSTIRIFAMPAEKNSSGFVEFL
ncbi:MAG: hypothetical protein M9928_14885 [Anaerolineae bacterium]|nr:hypothetical protein [Anaerolineae bacterium]MCO5187527.1 hypothetical protein [Anaerolineae bacterium]MCO5191707.1 hypothetical protein [Anaerolineae bacterium]MCO5197181.1 hypothetical protein [Anaerolineae bacterium]MCO5206318.1 hypothetical protein [Anaerolineae bacterium]